MGRMNETVKNQWLKDLRSGEFKQAEGYLKCADGFCCLGVLANQFADAWIADDVEDDTRRPVIGAVELGSDCTLDDDFANSLGLTPSLTSELMQMNDGYTLYNTDDSGRDAKHTFAEIADFVEKNL